MSLWPLCVGISVCSFNTFLRWSQHETMLRWTSQSRSTRTLQGLNVVWLSVFLPRSIYQLSYMLDSTIFFLQRKGSRANSNKMYGCLFKCLFANGLIKPCYTQYCTIRPSNTSRKEKPPSRTIYPKVSLAPSRQTPRPRHVLPTSQPSCVCGEGCLLFEPSREARHTGTAKANGAH